MIPKMRPKKQITAAIIMNYIIKTELFCSASVKLHVDPVHVSKSTLKVHVLLEYNCPKFVVI